MGTAAKKIPMNFQTMSEINVPQGRNGKHKETVTKILSDLDQVPNGTAIKVPLSALELGKENVRSALNRGNPQVRTQGCHRQWR